MAYGWRKGVCKNPHPGVHYWRVCCELGQDIYAIECECGKGKGINYEYDFLHNNFFETKAKAEKAAIDWIAALAHRYGEGEMAKYSLVGVNGNAFAVMAYVANAMKESGFTNEDIRSYKAEAMSGNYDNLLCESMEMIDKCNEWAEIEREPTKKEIRD